MAHPQRLVRLASALPPRLQRFLGQYPPATILTSSEQASMSSRTVVATPESPFQPWKHPVTGRWHDPKYSLRRQADLVKMAREHGVEELLPFTIKGTAERLRKRTEHGLRMRGTGAGQQVKGKQAERTMKARLEKRRQAMLEMPQLIQDWKERGHGRGWKKWPKQTKLS